MFFKQEETESDRLTKRVNALIEELGETSASLLTVKEIAYLNYHLTKPRFMSDENAQKLYDELLEFKADIASRTAFTRLGGQE